MKTLSSVLRPLSIAIACASVAACANTAPRQTEMDYRSRPPSAAQGTQGTPGATGKRLTIQSGEGERLNLPWFIRDTQDYINSQ